ncbi:Protein of unknown function [Propionibacterium freudenreichii]|nr:Protein of unknown function [Propionibacterium freudenreichii]CEG99423.1 Protein of unknown function [Propionibacterium freudenreichii]CEH03767.1 Protein of unknown function [Propionibacterium freudenreichii]CEI22103.1 Protein of unknown function [Propionibacterium freudenreichii]CEI29508.1 Protein of unknown function [Propionibacterium freudenreichii]
MKFEYGHSE